MSSMLDKIRSRNPIAEREFEWLGTVGAHQYARRKGKEYAVDRRISDPTSFKPEDDEIAVGRKHVERFDDGGEIVSVFTSRAWPVEPGTYEKLAAKRKKPDDKPMRAWDSLAVLPILQRREPMRLATGPTSSALDRLPALGTDQADALGAAVAAAHGKTTRQLIEVGGNEPPARSVAAMVAFVEERGVELSLQRGRLLARSRDPIRADVRELMEQAKELIVGYLSGKAVLCCMCAAPAVTIAAIDAPMCAEHAE